MQYDFVDAIERAPDVVLLVPLDVVRDEEVELAVAVVVEPGGAGREGGVAQAGLRGHVAELAGAFVVKEVVAAESGDVDVVAAVVIVIADRHAEAVDFDVEAAAARHVGERAVAVVAVERGGGVAAVRDEVLAVDEEDVEPAVAVDVEEGAARAHGLGEPLLARASGVVGELDSGGGGDVGEADGSAGGRRRPDEQERARVS